MANITAAITNEDVTVTHGSGNVFADLGFDAAEAEELQVKALLTYHVYDRIKALGLTQKQVVARLGISQPDVSRLMHCKHTVFSSDRLLGFLDALGLDIEILLRPRVEKVVAHRVRVHMIRPRRPRLASALKTRRTIGRRATERKRLHTTPRATQEV
jgi:predicted XRE-type DNA-binding protein